MGMGGQRHVPAALPQGMTRYPLYRRLGRPQGRSGRVLKISPPAGIRSPDRPSRRVTNILKGLSAYKAFSVHVTKAYGNGGISPFIPSLRARWK
jgi:hypothetical protein